MKTLKSVGIVSVVLIMVIGLFCFSLQTPRLPVSPVPDVGTSISPSSVRGILPYERIAKKVQLSDVVNQLAGRGLTFHLPDHLPNSLKLTAIWAEVSDSKISFPIEVVYSNSGNASIALAEIVIEVFPMEKISFNVTDSSKQRFTSIGDWTVFISEQAPIGWPEYSKKYGTESSTLLDLNIGGLDYLFRFAPVLTLEEAISVVASMRPATASSP